MDCYKMVQVKQEKDTFYPWYHISIHSTIGLQKWMEEVDILWQTSKDNRAAASPKKIWKSRARIESRFRVCWSWGSLVNFSLHLNGKITVAADFTDLLRLEVGWKIWKLVHRRHCGSTSGLYRYKEDTKGILTWQGKVLATLHMQMTVACCAEILLLTTHWDQLGKLKRNFATSNPRCNMHSPHPLCL